MKKSSSKEKLNAKDKLNSVAPESPTPGGNKAQPAKGSQLKVS